ncbi:hypothetical protein GCM10009664_19400 [Kitasatospora gansuensis]
MASSMPSITPSRVQRMLAGVAAGSEGGAPTGGVGDDVDTTDVLSVAPKVCGREGSAMRWGVAVSGHSCPTRTAHSIQKCNEAMF